MDLTPTRIEKKSPTEMLVVWSTGETFSLPFSELRFYCPCAVCVDEHTGQRTIKKEQITADIHPTDIQLIGRYAISVTWSDGHSTGMYHYDRLHELCEKMGSRINN